MSHEPNPPADPGGRLQLYSLALAGFVVLGGLTLGTGAWPRPTPAAPADLRAEAVANLRRDKPAPLSGPLATLLADAQPKLVPTQPHPLLGKAAPEFALADVDGAAVRLSELTARGPVVLVFYLGYGCDHCVSQLFGLNEDLGYLRELGAAVVAVSGDPARLTRERYAEYGAFGFPVLTDPDRLAAQRYGVFTPATDARPKWQAHGTFVIDRTGVIRWANTGGDAFTHNPTLLHELARLADRLPDDQPRSPQ